MFRFLNLYLHTFPFTLVSNKISTMSRYLPQHFFAHNQFVIYNIPCQKVERDKKSKIPSGVRIDLMGQTSQKIKLILLIKQFMKFNWLNCSECGCRRRVGCVCVTAAGTGGLPFPQTPLLKSKTNSKPSLKRWKADNNIQSNPTVLFRAT